jgi:type II secretory pathway pseudopilin PulG
MRGAPRHPPGFTLVEALVVIGVIAILIGISVPALRGARTRALETAVLAHQRQVGLSLTHYLNDHNGALPYYGVPGTALAPLKYHTGPNTGHWIHGPAGAYWMQPYYWAYFMLGKGYDATPAFTGPESQYEPPALKLNVHCLDIMTYTAFANPRFFSQGVEQTSSLYAGQRIQTVTYSSRKGVLLRYNSARLRNMPHVDQVTFNRMGHFVWFADGHGAMHSIESMRAGAPVRNVIPDGAPVLSTIDGLLGRDI